jgi:hypothetical protein
LLFGGGLRIALFRSGGRRCARSKNLILCTDIAVFNPDDNANIVSMLEFTCEKLYLFENIDLAILLNKGLTIFLNICVHNYKYKIVIINTKKYY